MTEQHEIERFDGESPAAVHVPETVEQTEQKASRNFIGGLFQRAALIAGLTNSIGPVTILQRSIKRMVNVERMAERKNETIGQKRARYTELQPKTFSKTNRCPGPVLSAEETETCGKVISANKLRCMDCFAEFLSRSKKQEEVAA